MFEELDIVTITHPIKEYKLETGEQGTVVLVYGNGVAYEVEFVNPDGTTKALLTLESSDLRLIESFEAFKIRDFTQKLENNFTAKTKTVLNKEISAYKQNSVEKNQLQLTSQHSGTTPIYFYNPAL